MITFLNRLGMAAFLLSSFCATSLAGESLKMKIGRFEARAILTQPDNGPSRTRPAIVMIPGSGSMGPEEMMPREVTLSDQDELLFNQFAGALNEAGFITLQLGKPGVEFFTPGEPGKLYDSKMQNELTWEQYMAHIDDAVEWVKKLPGVDPSRVFLFGHSEGTAAAVDYTERHPSLIRGIFLLGYTGSDFEHNVTWQQIDREIEFFLARDADLNHDGTVTHDEIAPWEDTFWFYQIPEGGSLTYQQARDKLWGFRGWAIERYRAYPFWKEIFSRGSLHARVAALLADVHVLNGELDVQTPASDSRELAAKCAEVGKANCFVTIVPGVGHGFSEPRGPRKQPLIDATLGPAQPSFLDELRSQAASALSRLGN